MDLATLEAEAAFADGEYATQFAGDLALCPRFVRQYERPRQRWDWRQFSAKLLGPLRDRDLLDYGCGMGEEAVCFAKLGARVRAIDASPVGVRLTRERAAANGLSDRVTAEVMDATATAFADDTFDLVHGLGILHHVGLRTGLTEVRRVLKPGGRAVFLEPLGSVAAIERCKGWVSRRLAGRMKLTPVTDHEENLRLPDVRACADLFAELDVYPYRLVSRVRKLVAPRFLYAALERFDYALLRIAPFLSPLAGAAVIHVRK